MGDLTDNLSRSEFKCRCGECTRTPVDFHLVTGIQDCIDHFMEEVLLSPALDGRVERVACHINSGHRCLPYDAQIKGLRPQDFNGIKLSEHVWGGGSDFWLEYVLFERNKSGKKERIKIDDHLVASYLESRYIGKCGIGRYHGRTHFDVRPGPSARWDNRSK